jgi:succinate-semialdehyde dehydrogenase/glutarate-semialdehyde dehydrogenase
MDLNLQNDGLLKTQAFINGRWQSSDEKSTFDVVNPATGKVIAQVARCGGGETLRAITAAHTALKDWRGQTAKHRANLLRNWYDMIMAHQEDLAQLLTAEQGKPLAEARAEIAYGARYIEWFSEEAKRIYGDTIAGSSSNQRIVCIKQPVGVVACITPWNFPNAMLTRKIAPALAAGCTVVCKPAGYTPLSALALAELADRAGLPAGVINIVAGSTQAISEQLMAHHQVRKMTFTGSTEVGKTLIKASAATVKKVSMELGGNAPFIVFDDADLDAAVTGAMTSKYRNAGQTCVCSNRLIVQAGIYEEFTQKLTEAVAGIKLGNGGRPGITMGPLINESSIDNVEAMVQDAIDKGARIVTGGRRSNIGACYYEPTILTGVNDQMRVFREEIFGPVAPIFTFDTEKEVIETANNTEFGLAAYFYSRDIGRIWRVAEALDYGIVGINEGLVSNEMAPFGGMKASGNGREGSKYGLDDYLEIKYLCMGGIDRVA